MTLPDRPRPVSAPPTRPRPGSTPTVASPDESPLPAKTAPALGYSLPPQPPGTPTRWQNGSSVFSAGHPRTKPRWLVPDEFCPGFLGRLHQDADAYVVYAWNTATRTYKVRGRKKLFSEALALLS